MSKRRKTLSIQGTLYMCVRGYAEQNELSVSSIVEVALADFLARQGVALPTGTRVGLRWLPPERRQQVSRAWERRMARREELERIASEHFSF